MCVVSWCHSKTEKNDDFYELCMHWDNIHITKTHAAMELKGWPISRQTHHSVHITLSSRRVWNIRFCVTLWNRNSSDCCVCCHAHCFVNKIFLATRAKVCFQWSETISSILSRGFWIENKIEFKCEYFESAWLIVSMCCAFMNIGDTAILTDSKKNSISFANRYLIDSNDMGQHGFVKKNVKLRKHRRNNFVVQIWDSGNKLKWFIIES